MANELPGESQSLAHMDPVTASRARALVEKVPMRKWVQLLVDFKPELHLDGLGLNSFDVLCIVRAVRFRHGRVKLLDLSSNPEMGDEGASHIARHLVTPAAGPKTLRSLFISKCGIGDEGVTALAKPLPVNRSLRILEMRKNKITDAGMVAFAEGLSKNRELASVFLSGNHVGDLGAEALMEGIKIRPPSKNPEQGLIWTVWMQDNPVYTEVKARITATLGKKAVRW